MPGLVTVFKPDLPRKEKSDDKNRHTYQHDAVIQIVLVTDGDEYLTQVHAMAKVHDSASPYIWPALILLLDNYDSFTYNLAQALRKLQDREVVVLRNDALTVEEAESYDSIVVSPGPGLPEDAGITISLLQRYIRFKPILGVCLGHQALICALGGSLRQLEMPLHGLDRKIRKLKEDALWENIQFPMATGRYHSWVAHEDSLPAELEVLAKGEEDSIVAIKHRDLPVYGVQFHPESVLTPQGEQLLFNWLKIAAQGTLSLPQTNRSVASRVMREEESPGSTGHHTS